MHSVQIKNKYKSARISFDSKKLMVALIASAPTDYLCLINTQKDQSELGSLMVTVKKIVKKMSDLFWMQKARNIKLENDDADDSKVMLTNFNNNFKEICYTCRKKGKKT